MTTKQFGGISVVTFMAIIGVVTMETMRSESIKMDLLRATYNTHSCANINFGSNAQSGVPMPSTLRAYTFDVNTIAASKLFEKYISDYQGITISSYTITKVFYNTADTHHYAIKVGTNGVAGSLLLNFEEQICGCSIYALSYKEENAIMVVNGEETTLLHDAPTLKKATTEEITYDRYDYNFAPTNTLEIKSKMGRDEDAKSRARFYVCNMVLRVVA